MNDHPLRCATCLAVTFLSEDELDELVLAGVLDLEDRMTQRCTTCGVRTVHQLLAALFDVRLFVTMWCARCRTRVLIHLLAPRVGKTGHVCIGPPAPQPLFKNEIIERKPYDLPRGLILESDYRYTSSTEKTP